MQKLLSVSWKFYVISGGILFLLFLCFSFLVHKNLFTHFDFDTTVRLQQHISTRFVGLFSFLSDIGKFEIVTSILVILCVVYLWKLRKWIGVVVMFFFYGLMHFIEIYGKTFVHHLPPPHFMLLTKDVFVFPEFYVQQTNSYPSGHAGRALFMTVFILVLAGKSKKIYRTQKYIILSALVVYDITMLISRIYLGEHWTSDVIGGTLLGLSMGFLGSIFI